MLFLLEKEFVAGLAVIELKRSDPEVQLTRNCVRLTAQGDDFLDAVRDHGNWHKTKQKLSDVGGGGLEVDFAVAMAYLTKKLGLSEQAPMKNLCIPPRPLR